MTNWILSEISVFLFFSVFFPTALSLKSLPCACREGSSSEVPILVVGNKRDLQRQRFMPRRAVSVLVKKTWKCGYVECSAKFNWHVVLLFKELLGIAVARGMRQNHTSIRLQGALQRNRCSIMWPRELPSPLWPQEWSGSGDKGTSYLNGWKYLPQPPRGLLLYWADFFIMRFIRLLRCKRHSWSSNHFLV